MNRALTVALLLVAPLLVAQTKPAAEAQPPAQAQPQATPSDPGKIKEVVRPDTGGNESPLVKAAKLAKARKQAGQPNKIVIDNDDVRNAKGKLILVTEKPLPEIKPLEKLPDDKKVPDRPNPAAAAKKVEEAKKEVASLENELARLEEEFYEEDDPDRRDSVLENRFDQAKKQLDRARQNLLDAREEQQRIEEQAATRNPNP